MEYELRLALYTALTAYAEALDEPLWIVWPNLSPEFDSDDAVPYAPLTRGYLKANVMSTEPEVLTSCGDGARFNWIFQVGVWVRENVSELVAYATVDTLTTAFPTKHQLASANHVFQFMAPADATPPVPVDGWYFIPVQFRIQTIR